MTQRSVNTTKSVDLSNHDMADIAEYGLRIKAPEGVDQSVAAFKKIDDAAAKTSNNLTKHAGAFAAAVAKHTNGASMMLRLMGSLGGEAGHLAERLERTAVATEHMIAKTANSASQTKILEAAHKSGSIAAATMEAAQMRLTAARGAATTAELAYAAAVAKTREAQEMSQITALAVREQKLVTTGANRAASGSGVFSTETDNAVRQQRLLNEVQRDAVVSSNTLRAAQQEERAVKQELTAANKEAAAAQKLMNEASAGSTTGFGTAALVITSLVGVLVVLAAGIYAVHKAWHLLTESIHEASEQQKQAFPLGALIGNAKLAKEKVEELHHFWEEAGVFKFKDIAEAAKSLTLMGTGTENLMDRLKSLGAISIATGEDLKGQVAAYERVRLSIEKGTDIQIRGMGAMGAGMLTIIRSLMDETGKTEAEVMRMFKEHKVGIDLVDRALANATTGTGRYAAAQGGYMKTLIGAQTVFGTRWEAIKDTLGAPIRDALTPLVTQATHALEGLKPVAEEVGVRIAGIVEAFAKVAEDEGWRNAIKAAWEVLLEELSIRIKTSISKAFTDVFENALKLEKIPFNEIPRSLMNAFADEQSRGTGVIQSALVAMVAGGQAAVTGKVILAGQETAKAYVDGSVTELDHARSRLKTALEAVFAPVDARTLVLNLDTEPVLKALEELFKLPAGLIEAFGKDASREFTNGALEQIDLSKGDIQLALQDAFKLTTLGSPSLSDTGVGPIPLRTPETHDIKTEFMGKIPRGGGGRESDWEKFKSDLKIVNDYWEEYSIIQSKAATETERTRRTIEAEVKTAHALADPTAYLDAFTTIEGKWAAMEEARLRKAEEIDTKIKMGTASVSESMVRGFEKAMESWGTFQTKVSKFAEDALNRIGDGFATAFGDVITGTKSAGEAFRDMAVSMLEDIARLIIKMIVLQALQAALGGLGIGGGSLSAGASLGRAGGGPVYGGSGTRDDVPIMGMAGEYMIRKDVVRHEGIEAMSALNRGDAHIIRHMADGGLVGGISSGQMISVGAGMRGGGGKVEININVDSHDSVSTETATGGGLDAEDWKQLARAVGQMVDKKLADGRRFRGALNPA